MRYLFGFICVLALGVMGCSETSGAAGDGGSAGVGGGGMGGASGNAGNGASGGGVLESCEGADDLVGCKGPGYSVCINQICMIGDCAEAEEWAHCNGPAEKGFFLGFCQAGTCVPECSVLEEGQGCHAPVGPDWRGICTETRYGVICEPRCVSDAHCDDFNDCTVDRCLASGACELFPQQDGTVCAGGTCEAGECNLNALEMPCTEQGVRNAARIGGGPFTFECGGPTTVVVNSGKEITVEKDVRMDGGGNLTIASAPSTYGVVLVNEGVVAELTRLTLAGIYNYGTLRLSDSLLTGGSHGLTNRGVATLTNCTVSGNESDGIYNIRATLTMVSCTIANNGSDGFRSIDNEGSTLNASNSLVAGSCRRHSTAVTVTSLGHNIEVVPSSCSACEGNTCGFDQSTDQVNVSADDLKLGELADNGGPTETHALGAGSVAIDVIPAVDCVDVEGEPLTTDQRGLPRPGGTMCDVGAFEVQP